MVGYEVPDPNSLDDALQAIQRLNHEGQAMGETVLVPGRCMGLKDDLAYVFSSDETGGDYRYFVKAYSF